MPSIRFRAEAQALHKQLEDAATKNEAAIRTDLQAVADLAQKLAHSLKANADAQHADAKQHLQIAVHRAMLGMVREATQHPSHAVAARRSEMAKAKS